MNNFTSKKNVYIIAKPERSATDSVDTLRYWLIEHAQAHGCQGVHLDSGYQRHHAHQLYLNKGFQLSSHHFCLTFNT